jgi:signal transduction histidine kinase
VNLAAVLSLLGLVCYAALTYIVAAHAVRSQERPRRLFLVMLATMAASQASALVVSLARSESLALVGYQAMSTMAIAAGMAYAAFVRAFLGLRVYSRVIVGGGILCALTLAVLVTAPTWIMLDLHWSAQAGFYLPEMAPGSFAVGGVYFVLLGYAVALLSRAYRQARSPMTRRRTQYLLLGWTVVIAGSMANFVPGLKPYPVDMTAMAVNAALIAYAILRHQLLDISLIIRKGLLYSVPTAALAIVYFVLVVVLEGVLRTFVGYQLFFLSVLVAAATAVAVQPLRDRVQLFIDRLFFREKYDTQLMLQELSELVGSILDIEELSSLLLDRLTVTMHVEHACIMLREKGTARLHMIAQKGQADPMDEAMLHEEHPVVQWLIRHRQSLSRYDLDLLPQFKALWVEEREILDRLEAELFVPLMIQEELIGMLILGPKLSEVGYAQDEQLALTTLANQTAVAIQNAWLYSDLGRSLETLQQMQARLVQSEKLSAIGEMIAGVAHEINNPLTAVIGYSQLLQMQSMDQDVQIQEDLGQILEAGMRMKRIVANLLDFSRQHEPQKEYVDINQILSTCLALRMNELTNCNIEVQTDLVSDLPLTLADRHQLQQVFVNIINNAQQAMVEKGGPGVLRVSTQRQRNNTILVRLQDTGPGIPEELMNRIFDPFFTTKEVGKGTGLGLSVSYGIVQEHEGRIWAESSDGQGATFLIELPIRKSVGPADRVEHSRPVLVRGRVA